MNSKLPISALVVSCNDGMLLEDCLKSLYFCDQILLVDLESKDNTIQIAKKYNAETVSHAKVDMVEYLFPEFVPNLKNDWVMLIDPDERLDKQLVNDIFDFFNDIPNDCGKINVPIVYYYKGKALKGTVWGGNKTGRLLIKRSACHIGNNVHVAIQLKEGYTTYKIKRKEMNVDHHFWVQSYEQMLDKHKRYTSKEGKAMFDKGLRYSILNHFKKSIGAFKECFWTYKGYKDGFLGLFLSLFYAWYIHSSWVSLKQYQGKLK